MDTITVTFPTFNNKKDVKENLKSLSRISFPKSSLEVIVVDNNSSDGTPNLIKKSFPAVKLILLNKNVGFAKAINLGIERSKSQWIFVTNADVIFDKNTFKNLLSFAQKDPEIGIVGPKILSVKNNIPSPKDMPGFDCNLRLGRLHSLPVDKIKKLEKPTEVDWVSGSALLFKKELVKKIGYFDERFFAYWEDADFGVRTQKAGFKSYLVPSATLWHKGSVILGEDSPQKIYYLVRNSRLFLYKHLYSLGKILQISKDLLFTLGSLTRLIFDFKNKDKHKAKLIGLYDYYTGRFGQRKLTA